MCEVIYKTKNERLVLHRSDVCEVSIRRDPNEARLLWIVVGPLALSVWLGRMADYNMTCM